MPELIFGVKIDCTYWLNRDEVETAAMQLLLDAFGPKTRAQKKEGDEFLQAKAGGCTVTFSHFGNNVFLAKVGGGSLAKCDPVRSRIEESARGFNEALALARELFKPLQAQANAGAQPGKEPAKVGK